MTQIPTIANPMTLVYKGKDVLMVSKSPVTMGLMIPAILPRPEAVPTAVPLTLVSNTSGV